MKILLDENLPHALRHELANHDVYTVQYLGWSGMKNGALLAQANASQFDAMITMDSGVPFEQNIAKLPLGVVVLSAKSNDMDDLRPLLPRLLETLTRLAPGSVVHVV